MPEQKLSFPGSYSDGYKNQNGDEVNPCVCWQKMFGNKTERVNSATDEKV
jgi:hypothetical protein